MMINTARGYCLVVALSAICTSLAAADNFKCDQAARFGYFDSLCEKPEKIVPNIAQSPKLDASAEASVRYDRGEGWNSPMTQDEIYRQSERANERAWENYRSWNPVSPVYPYAFVAPGQWSPLKFPPITLKPPAPPTSQTTKPKAFAP